VENEMMKQPPGPGRARPKSNAIKDGYVSGGLCLWRNFLAASEDPGRTLFQHAVLLLPQKMAVTQNTVFAAIL